MSMSSTRTPSSMRAAPPAVRHAKPSSGATLVAALLVPESSLPLLRLGDGAPRARAGLMIRRTGRLPLPALRSRAGRFPVSELAAKQAVRPAQAAIALQELLVALADRTTCAGVRARMLEFRGFTQASSSGCRARPRKDGQANCKDQSIHLHTRTSGASDKWCPTIIPRDQRPSRRSHARSSPSLGLLLRERTRAGP
jgi:hypothetical protein